MTTTSITRYRTRPAEVEAIRWTGENCKAVFAFIGWPPCGDDELDHSQLLGLGDNGDATAGAGDWVVRVADDRFEVLTDEEFRAQYEACDGGAS